MALLSWILSILPAWPYSLTCLFVLYTFHELYWKRRYLPPGPVPWLLLGNMLDVLTHLNNIDLLFQKYKQKYGGAFTFWIGPFQMVMICEISLLKKYFIKYGDIFSGRWRNFITDSMLDGFNGVIQTDGEKWREQRRFSLHVLRDFGFGRAFMEDKIMSEVNKLMKNLERFSDSGEIIEPDRIEQTKSFKAKIVVFKHLGACVGNIINDILFSKTFEYNDQTFIRMQNILDNQSTLVLHPAMGLYLTAPLTIHIPLLNNPWRRLMKLRNDFWDFLDVQIQEHKEKFINGQCDLSDFTYVYMKEMESRQLSGKDMGHFSEIQLKMLLLDLFFAGSETTVTTTKWAILMMILHPEVQQKVQAELDQLPPKIELSHRNKLTYLQATINEIQRIANILPINLLRTVTEDIKIDGYHFKEGSMVLPQISILMNDPTYFPEPEQFNPDRFLDENQNLKKFEAFIPFSIGKRQCLGESLAKMELFLIFANLLRNFEFQPIKGEPLPSRQRVYGLTVSPAKFKCVVKRRGVIVSTKPQLIISFVFCTNGSFCGHRKHSHKL
ncbi:Unspecific monooxygenase [Aphelenchoides bicaudatus]|nr:Unspecific monooxygenase [Aphelenchoides bicaudatus]